MCGRYASSRGAEDLIEIFEVDTNAAPAPLAADYNIAPTKPVYVVLERSKDQLRERQLRVLTWGLIPSWAKDASIAPRLINARMETVTQKPSFKRAFAARRCLLPADGYFEWYPTTQTDPPGKPQRQPFFIRPRDGSVLAMAGLYEIWRDPTRTEQDPQRFRWTCTVLTTRAEDELGQIHDRMPLMVAPEQWGTWLDPTQQAGADLLVAAAPGALEAFPVSKAVGNVRNNGPRLIEPIPIEGGVS